MNKTLVLAGTLLAALSTTAQAAGDPAAGKAKSAVCAACHGMNGVSNNDLWPNLAGQKAGYLVKALKDFKAGNRNDPMMSSQAKMLSEEDMANLAAYYSSL